MYANVLRGISKVRRNADSIRAVQNGVHWHDGLPSGIVVPTHWYTAVITALVIQLVALFDNALESYITANCPEFTGQSLGRRINHLSALGVLTDGPSLEALRKRRNELAHEADGQVTWADFDLAYDTVQRQLDAIGATPNNLNRPTPAQPAEAS